MALSSVVSSRSPPNDPREVHSSRCAGKCFRRALFFLPPPLRPSHPPPTTLDISPPVRPVGPTYLRGKYRKYNNNYGYVGKDARNTPQAFTHFSYGRAAPGRRGGGGSSRSGPHRWSVPMSPSAASVSWRFGGGTLWFCAINNVLNITPRPMPINVCQGKIFGKKFQCVSGKITSTFFWHNHI